MVKKEAMEYGSRRLRWLLAPPLWRNSKGLTGLSSLSNRSIVGCAINENSKKFWQRQKTDYIFSADACFMNSSNNGTLPRYFVSSSTTTRRNNDDENNDSNTTTSWLPLTQVLEQGISQGLWKYDCIQRQTAQKLERLQSVLRGYSNKPAIDHYEYLQQQQQQQQQQKADNKDPGKQETGLRNGIRDQIRQDESVPLLSPPRIPRGLYLHGPVGTGKTMLMDLFFQHAPVSKKKRFHYHKFIMEIHNAIHQLKQEQLQTWGRDYHVNIDPKRNPIRQVATQWAQDTALLCLDEFQVTDIADAVILSQFFSTLWSLGTVVVATSNQLPGQLYQDGLNRSYFLPFIHLLQKHCLVHTLQSDLDYRVTLSASLSSPSAQLTQLENLFFGSDRNNTNNSNNNNMQNGPSFEEFLVQLRDHRPVTPVSLDVGHQRTMILPRGDADGWLAHVDFDELCETERGAADYRALAQHFSIVAIADIPAPLSLLERDINRARRFVTLIDELYESRSTALTCSVTTITTTTTNIGATCYNPQQLFCRRKKAATHDGRKNEEESPVDLEYPARGSMASVRELAFAFDRAASRMVQMTSWHWWDVVLNKKHHINYIKQMTL